MHERTVAANDEKDHKQVQWGSIPPCPAACYESFTYGMSLMQVTLLPFSVIPMSQIPAYIKPNLHLYFVAIRWIMFSILWTLTYSCQNIL